MTTEKVLSDHLYFLNNQMSLAASCRWSYIGGEPTHHYCFMAYGQIIKSASQSQLTRIKAQALSGLLSSIFSFFPNLREVSDQSTFLEYSKLLNRVRKYPLQLEEILSNNDGLYVFNDVLQQSKRQLAVQHIGLYEAYIKVFLNANEHLEASSFASSIIGEWDGTEYVGLLSGINELVAVHGLILEDLSLSDSSLVQFADGSQESLEDDQEIVRNLQRENFGLHRLFRECAPSPINEIDPSLNLDLFKQLLQATVEANNPTLENVSALIFSLLDTAATRLLQCSGSYRSLLVTAVESLSLAAIQVRPDLFRSNNTINSLLGGANLCVSDNKNRPDSPAAQISPEDINRAKSVMKCLGDIDSHLNYSTEWNNCHLWERCGLFQQASEQIHFSASYQENDATATQSSSELVSLIRCTILDLINFVPSVEGNLHWFAEQAREHPEDFRRWTYLVDVLARNENEQLNTSEALVEYYITTMEVELQPLYSKIPEVICTFINELMESFSRDCFQHALPDAYKMKYITPESHDAKHSGGRSYNV